MKTPGLSFVLLLCVVFWLCLAAEAQQPSPEATTPHLDYSKPNIDLAATWRTQAKVSKSPFEVKSAPVFADSSDYFCAYMRTYRVKTVSPGSDAVTPAGYTTCVPSARFEMRNAVSTQTDDLDKRKEAGDK